MTEKKILTEKEINELSEEQLTKVSGGYSSGDSCPDCKVGTLLYNRSYGGYYCNNCSFTTYNPRSEQD